MKKDILICGVGGQGTVLASKLLASAFMEQGEEVHSAETIGMAQRGGSVTSHVRIGKSFSPLIPFRKADLILAFEPAEAVRNLNYLKPDGLVIVNRVPVKPATDSLQNSGYEAKPMIDYLKKTCDCIVVDGEKVITQFGSAKFLNLAILGTAEKYDCLGLKKEDLLCAIERVVHARYVNVNKQVFEEAEKGAFL